MEPFDDLMTLVFVLRKKAFFLPTKIEVNWVPGIYIVYI